MTENLVSSPSSGSSGGCPESADANRIAVISYNADGNIATLSAHNSQTGTQTTTYTYGTTLADSDVAASTLLRQVAYPDSTGGSDVVQYGYNRQAEQTTLTDQRGCVHAFDYDLLGRLIHDRVTTLGTGVDGAIRRLSARSISTVLLRKRQHLLLRLWRSWWRFNARTCWRWPAVANRERARHVVRQSQF